jgi:drug/metabolite transporter (DMT)-like permease
VPEAALGIAFALLSGGMNAFLSQVLRKQGEVPGEQSAFRYTLVWSRVLFALLFMLLIGGDPGRPMFLITSTVGGIFQCGNFIFILIGIMMGPIAIGWTITWLAAPLIGILWALYPGNEPWSANQFIGLGLFLVCLTTMGFSTHLHNRRSGIVTPVRRYFFTIMILAMLCGSMNGYFNKLSNDYAPVTSGSASVYLLVVAFVTAVGFSLYNLIRKHEPVFNKGIVAYGLLAGGIAATQLTLMAYGLKLIEVSRFFPIAASSAITLSAVLSAFWQKEVPSAFTVIGMLLSIGAIVFFSIG